MADEALNWGPPMLHCWCNSIGSKCCYCNSEDFSVFTCPVGGYGDCENKKKYDYETYARPQVQVPQHIHCTHDGRCCGCNELVQE